MKPSKKAKLSGSIALVTGASRGAGRAIAEELGSAGATVIVVARSSQSGTSTESLPGTIEETAGAVTRLGGAGTAIKADLSVESDVVALAEQIRSKHGRLDILVNNAWGGYEQYDGARFDAPFWEHSFEERWRGMFVSGVRPALLVSRHLAPLMMVRNGGDAQRPGLIVSTVAWAYGAYLGNLYYDVAKAAIVRMTHDLASELRERRIAAVALAPGFMRTERVMVEHAKHEFDLGHSESPTYVARAVVALATDAKLMKRSGQVFAVGDLAREYEFTDEDGRQPEPFRMPGAESIPG